MNRKDEHIHFALKQKRKRHSLDKYTLSYYSIPNFNIKDIDLSVKIGNVTFDFPIYINAITAGSEKAEKINKKLEYVAKKTNIFFFPGSYSPILKNPNEFYPKNFGVNLGIDKKHDLHLKAIKETNAKFLQVHVNLIQEILMPEGDKNFQDWEENLKNIIKHSPIPLILKETGFGMNKESIKKAIDLGVKIIDISSNDGTNFAKIENDRRKIKKRYFENIGYSLAESLINASEFSDKIEILASGGINNPTQVVKALALGAKAVGISRFFLNILEKYGEERLITVIEEWKKDIKYLFLITNSKNISEIKRKNKGKVESIELSL